MLSVLDGVDAFLCWPAGGGKTRLMRILAAMFPRCLSLVICPLALAREQCHEVHEALGQYAQVTWGFRQTAYVFGGTNQYDWDETIGYAARRTRRTLVPLRRPCYSHSPGAPTTRRREYAQKNSIVSTDSGPMNGTPRMHLK